MKLFPRSIVLQDGSWVGARATLSPGTNVGVGAIVTLGSVATGEIPAYQIWGGNPARYLRERQVNVETNV